MQSLQEEIDSKEIEELSTFSSKEQIQNKFNQ